MALLVGCVRIMLSPCACIRVLEREGESGWPVRLMHKYTACSLAHGLVNEENAYVDKCKGLSVTESLNIITHAHASTHTQTHTQSSKPSRERVPAHLVSSDSMSASHSKRFQSRQRCWRPHQPHPHLACIQSPSYPTYPSMHTFPHAWTLIYLYTTLECKKILLFFVLLSCFIQKYTRVSEWECRLFLYCACACLRVSVRACVHTVFFYTWLPSLLDIIIVIWSPW